MNDLTGRLETLIDKNYSNVKSSYQIGEDGENFVLSSLTSAFPNNTGTIYIRTVRTVISEANFLGQMHGRRKVHERILVM